MRGLFAGIVLLLILVSLDRFPSSGGYSTECTNVSMFDPVDPSTIQDTISEIQQKEQSVYPIDTLYFNRVEGGGYQARFLFLNTSNYAGVQYDVNVDASGKIAGGINKSVPAEFKNPFGGYTKDFKFGNLNVVAPTPDMKKVWDAYTVKV